MKKTYTVPKLKIYGTLTEITEAQGISSVRDTLFFSGEPLDVVTSGSRDLRLP
jgi:hypothetical protein